MLLVLHHAAELIRVIAAMAILVNAFLRQKKGNHSRCLPGCGEQIHSQLAEGKISRQLASARTASLRLAQFAAAANPSLANIVPRPSRM